ncbi:MAG: hypothetical protein EPO42_12920 [Gallionellaceae bacterium]|nr:MAG: hypothetical protein EPO42_12920 [Gallionellaceae bacterium]
MKKMIVLMLLLGATLASPFARAEGKELSFWDKLRKKVETVTPQKKIGATNAVGGVRGALSDAHDIYWKGEAVPVEIDPAELGAFKKAMDLATTGETKQARDAFAEFVKNYPNSSLRKDADQALAALGK